MKINGVEFEFDVHDVDQAEALEKAIEEMGEDEKKVLAAAETKKLSDTNKAVISMIGSFFTRAVGVDVVKDCRNSATAVGFYDEFLAEVGKQKDNIFTRYSAKRVR